MQLETVQSSPLLHARASTGLTKYWQAHLLRDAAGNYYTQSSHWQATKSGGRSAQQYSEPYLAQPVNQGRANATTPEAQGLLEFNAMVKRQREAKRYSEEPLAERVQRAGAMLAHPYEKYPHKLQFPCYCQPKYDGNRMLYVGDGSSSGTGWSRGDKDYLAEVLQHLHVDTHGRTFDGEVLLPGNVPLQQTASAVKRFRPGVSDTLEFVVFDVVGDEPFEARYSWLYDHRREWPAQVRLAPTTAVNSQAAFDRLFAEYVAAGFEGLIARNAQAAYAVGQRSVDLLKYKPFLDSEFEVVAVVAAGGGAAALQAKLVLRTATGEQFESMLNGTDAERQQVLALGSDAYRGSWVTVRYQALTDRGVPQFPRVVAFRDRGEF